MVRPKPAHFLLFHLRIGKSAEESGRGATKTHGFWVSTGRRFPNPNNWVKPSPVICHPSAFDGDESCLALIHFGMNSRLSLTVVVRGGREKQRRNRFLRIFDPFRAIKRSLPLRQRSLQGRTPHSMLRFYKIVVRLARILTTH